MLASYPSSDQLQVPRTLHEHTTYHLELAWRTFHHDRGAPYLLFRKCFLRTLKLSSSNVKLYIEKGFSGFSFRGFVRFAGFAHNGGAKVGCRFTFVAPIRIKNQTTYLENTKYCQDFQCFVKRYKLGETSSVTTRESPRVTALAIITCGDISRQTTTR